MAKIPKYLEDKPTRYASNKQEKNIKKILSRLTKNSGATFKENDVESDFYSVEAKTTAKLSYRITSAEIKKMAERNLDMSKTPFFEIELGDGTTVIVLRKDDFINLFS